MFRNDGPFSRMTGWRWLRSHFQNPRGRHKPHRIIIIINLILFVIWMRNHRHRHLPLPFPFLCKIPTITINRTTTSCTNIVSVTRCHLIRDPTKPQLWNYYFWNTLFISKSSLPTPLPGRTGINPLKLPTIKGLAESWQRCDGGSCLLNIWRVFPNLGKLSGFVFELTWYVDKICDLLEV